MNLLANLIKSKLVLVILLLVSFPILAESLKDYLWTNRIIVTFSDSASNKERQLLLQQMETERCEFRVRDLVHIDLIKGSDDYDRLKHTFSIPDQAEFKLLLIGKDGKEKLTTHSGDLKTIFSIIDSMPTRKKEMPSSKCLLKNNKE